MKLIVIALVAILLTSCGGSTSGTPDSKNSPTPSAILEWTTAGQKSGTNSTEPHSFTIFAKFTLTSNATANQRVIEKGGANNGGGFDIETNGAGDQIRCLVWSADGTAYRGAMGAITMNAEHKVACSYDGDLVSLYIDGTLVDTESGVSYTDANSDYFVGVAASGLSGNRDFLGSLDEVKVFDIVLGSSEISGL